MQNLIFKISESIRKGELTIYCGAGISWNSGLPLADELKQAILEKLPMNAADRDEVVKSNLPFEAFIETLSENTDISKLLDVFEQGIPNANHTLIARLAKNGYLKTIFTTNFDLLIEKALEKEGLIRNKDFRVYFNEDQFSEIDFEKIDGGIIKIFKLHGTVEVRGSIRTTMKAVASRTLSEKRMNLIRYLFSTGSHRKVLILGYSCSDEFDITPQIQSLEESQKEIIFIDHFRKEEKMEDIKTKDDKNPFRWFTGTRVICDTDKFMRKLWKSLRQEEYELIPSEKEREKIAQNIEGLLNKWANGLEKDKGYLKYAVAGLMFYRISNYEKTIGYYTESLNITEEINNEIGKGVLYTNLGLAYYNLGNINDAIKYHCDSLTIHKRNNNISGRARCCVNLGLVYYNLGDFEKAVEHYRKALELFEEVSDNAGWATCYMNLGIVYYASGNFGKAVEHYRLSLKLFEDVGDKTNEANCYINLANAYHIVDINKSVECLTKALQLYEKTGDIAGKAKYYANLGDVYYDLKLFEATINLYKESLKICERIGNKVLKARCHGGLGLSYHSLGNFAEAGNHYDISLKISKETGNKTEEARCYEGFGFIYHNLHQFTRAISYYEKALKIAQEVGNKFGEAAHYTQLGSAHYHSKKFKIAIEYFLKAEEIFFSEKSLHHYLIGVRRNLYSAYYAAGDNVKAEEYDRLVNSG